MKIDEIQYKGYNIEIKYVKAAKTFYASSMIGLTSDHKNIDDAVEEQKKLIDSFLSIDIDSYNKLTEELTKSIYYDDYEEYMLDVDIVKHLVDSFIKNNNERKDQITQQRIDAAYVRLHNSIEDFECIDKETACKVLAPFSVYVFLFVDGNELVADRFLDAVLKLDEEYNTYIVSAIQHFYDSTKM